MNADWFTTVQMIAGYSMFSISVMNDIADGNIRALSFLQAIRVEARGGLQKEDTEETERIINTIGSLGIRGDKLAKVKDNLGEAAPQKMLTLMREYLAQRITQEELADLTLN